MEDGDTGVYLEDPREPVVPSSRLGTETRIVPLLDNSGQYTLTVGFEDGRLGVTLRPPCPTRPFQ